jgi:Ni2+-binding GTPase involved in maturation of urease and hydrogenase
MEIVELSCQTGAGLDDWMKWLARRRESTAESAG